MRPLLQHRKLQPSFSGYEERWNCGVEKEGDFLQAVSIDEREIRKMREFVQGMHDTPEELFAVDAGIQHPFGLYRWVWPRAVWALLHIYQEYYQWDRFAAVLLFILGLVTLLDLAGEWVRRQVAPRIPGTLVVRAPEVALTVEEGFPDLPAFLPVSAGSLRAIGAAFTLALSIVEESLRTAWSLASCA